MESSTLKSYRYTEYTEDLKYVEFEDHNFKGPPLGPRHDAQEGSPPVIGEWESTVQWRCHVRADGLMISGSFMIYMYIVYVRIYIYIIMSLCNNYMYISVFYMSYNVLYMFMAF